MEEVEEDDIDGHGGVTGGRPIEEGERIGEESHGDLIGASVEGEPSTGKLGKVARKLPKKTKTNNS